jgi:nitric oxide reductase activation protein
MSASSGGQSELTLDSTRSGQSRFVQGVIDPKRVDEKSAQAASLKDQKADARQPVDRAIGEGDEASDVAKSGQQTGDGNATQNTYGACKKIFLYDEWDYETDDYRRQFCHVHEESGVTKGAQGEAFYELVMSEYKGIIQSLKRAFQYLAPDTPIWIKGESEGEQFDLNRLVENRVEAKISPFPSDRIYMRREKKERSVSAAFLLDMSGSTERRLKSGKSVLQIEKEALVLLSHAMDAVGDRFALYGFSGRGNEHVMFHILKNFQTQYKREIAFCIGNATPMGQNRDGAAIRHATANLACEIAKTKILIFISDGRPQDDHYAGSYAMADTKKALREARQKGVYPFCIVIDPTSHNRGEEVTRLKAVYGNTPYLVLDCIETLPTRLPEIYKRLTT